MNAALAHSDGSLPNNRLHFLAVHLYDLQTLRWLGLHLSLICCPVLLLVRPWQAWCLLVLMSAGTAGWFLWFGHAMRARFGVTRLTRLERMRLRYPSQLLALVPLVFLVGHFYCRYVLHMHSDDFLFGWPFVAWLMAPVVDRTNPKLRRTAYAAALTMVVAAYAVFATRALAGWHGALFFSVLGTAFLALALFDYTLLCRAAAGEQLHPGWTA